VRTPSSTLPEPPGFGLDTNFQAVPFQCSVSSGSRLGGLQPVLAGCSGHAQRKRPGPAARNPPPQGMVGAPLVIEEGVLGSRVDLQVVRDTSGRQLGLQTPAALVVKSLSGHATYDRAHPADRIPRLGCWPVERGDRGPTGHRCTPRSTRWNRPGRTRQRRSARHRPRHGWPAARARPSRPGHRSSPGTRPSRLRTCAPCTRSDCGPRTGQHRARHNPPRRTGRRYPGCCRSGRRPHGRPPRQETAQRHLGEPDRTSQVIRPS
jgi:hypothetical protein